MTSSQRHADGGHERPGEALRLGFVLWVTVSVFLLLARCAYICLVRGPVFTEMAVAQRAHRSGGVGAAPSRTGRAKCCQRRRPRIGASVHPRSHLSSGVRAVVQHRRA